LVNPFDVSGLTGLYILRGHLPDLSVLFLGKSRVTFLGKKRIKPSMITNEQINKCVEVAHRYGAKKLVLIGSAAINLEIARDIDLICEGVNGMRLLKMAAEMENETGAQVDTVSGDEATLFVKYNVDRGKVLYEAA
jgi:predicted nucleotidyltransferase